VWCWGVVCEGVFDGVRDGERGTEEAVRKWNELESLLKVRCKVNTNGQLVN